MQSAPLWRWQGRPSYSPSCQFYWLRSSFTGPLDCEANPAARRLSHKLSVSVCTHSTCTYMLALPALCVNHIQAIHLTIQSLQFPNRRRTSAALPSQAPSPLTGSLDQPNPQPDPCQPVAPLTMKSQTASSQTWPPAKPVSCATRP